ncbi:DedD protein [Bradyrhizobiaceae bacterium SG-6C]|nr:DedD protein [Bradyrhizobiaceae bacterium SG-6C]
MLVLLLVAFVAALVFGLSYMQRERSGENKRVEAKAEPRVEPKAETKAEPKTEPKTAPKADAKAEAKTAPMTEAKPAATATPAVSPPGSRPQAESSSAPATAKAEAKAETGTLAQPPRPADADRSVPSFDITRVERTGDAVIAGRAAPGATVELLRDGESLGRAVADQSGQFVMTPPPLPPGNYELTLRSRLPDGKQAISEQKMVVALDAADSASPAVRSRAEAPRPVTEDNKMASRSAPEAGGPSDARLPSKKRAPSAVVVSRGDSLWRISRATYGSGELYPLLLRANRSRIRDPDLIYPGQSFVLPRRSR